MRYPFSRLFATLAFVPLLLSFGLTRVQAQTTVFDTDGLDLGDLQSLTTLTYLGRQESRPAQLGVEILPLDAQQLLNQLDATRPEESNSSRVRDLLARLQKLQKNYTVGGRLDEASVLEQRIEAFLAGRSGVEPDPGNLTGFRDQVGKTHMFRVIGHRTGSIWGNQLYTDDSDLGTVAVHAGLLRDGQAGVVKVTILAGQDQYDGGEANGITSSTYATWQGSYTVAPGPILAGTDGGKTMPEEAQKLVDELTKIEEKVSADRLWKGMDSLQKMLETAQHAEKLDQALAIREGMRALIIKMAGAQPDPGQLTSLRGQIGKSFYFVVTGKVSGSIWGNGIYTDDSDLGTVAVHAGLLREGQRGIVKVTIRRGLEGYDGAEHNGVASGSYGPWQGSYRVSAFQMPPRP